MFESFTNTNVTEICEQLKEAANRRRDHIRARTRLTNQIKAICRRLVDVNGKDDKEGLKKADELYKLYCKIHKHGLPQEDLHIQYIFVRTFFIARDAIDEGLKPIERMMKGLAEQLPVCDWVKSVRGFGVMNLACVVGETGDLSNYANPGKVWKRMGLAVFNGERQRKTTDKELAIEMGYSPRRRSTSYMLGDCLIKGNRGEYRSVYDARKAYEIERNPEMTKAHAHARAQRYMEKRVIRDLWKAWRGQTADRWVSP